MICSVGYNGPGEENVGSENRDYMTSIQSFNCVHGTSFPSFFFS